MRLWLGALGAVVVCVAIGGGVGYAVGGSSTSGPSASFSASPMSADPSVPVDPQTSYAPDNAMPPLSTSLTYTRVSIGDGATGWSIEVPQGWTAGPGAKGTDSTIWRPPNELPGGYQVRVEPLQGRTSIKDQMSWQTRYMPAGTSTEYSTPTTIWFDYRDQPSGLHRFDFFTWVASPGTAYAGLEISVAGRDIDVDGLNALLQHVRSSAHKSAASASTPASPSASSSASSSGSSSGSPSGSASGSGGSSASVSG
jgi:hypothetical protein